jgi:hypothetical protein
MKKQAEHSVATSLCSAPPTESAGARSSLPPDILLCVRNAKSAFCATDCTGVNSFLRFIVWRVSQSFFRLSFSYWMNCFVVSVGCSCRGCAAALITGSCGILALRRRRPHLTFRTDRSPINASCRRPSRREIVIIGYSLVTLITPYSVRPGHRRL